MKNGIASRTTSVLAAVIAFAATANAAVIFGAIASASPDPAADCAASFDRFMWVELIGFDNTSRDYGVDVFLTRLPMKPQAVSLLLVDSRLFEEYHGLAEDYPLPPGACAYGARPFNEDRNRQAWSAYQLRGLVGELKRNGVRAYASFFEWGRRDITAEGADGKPYVETFIRTTTAFLRDFGFDGLHAADGYGHPRKSLAARGLSVESCREESGKWADFWMKAATAFKQSGLDVYINTCWTRDPYEALVRYGVDYRLLANAPIDGFIVESSAACLSMEGWNWTPESPLDKCVAMAMRLKASVPGKKLLLLHCIKDGNEQYNALRHAPAKAAAEALALGCLRYGDKPVFDGVMACLADGISRDEWAQLHRTWSLAFSDSPMKPEGCRAVWCDAALDNEVDAVGMGHASSSTLLSALVARGAPIGGIVSVDEVLGDKSMPLLILNPGSFPKETLEALCERKAAVVMMGDGVDHFDVPPVDAEPKNWLYPLRESRPAADAIDRAARELANASAVALEGTGEGFALSSFLRPDGTRLVVARNNRDVYGESSVRMSGSCGAVTALTDDPSLPVRTVSCPDGTRFSVKIPPGGAVVLSAASSASLDESGAGPAGPRPGQR